MGTLLHYWIERLVHAEQAASGIVPGRSGLERQNRLLGNYWQTPGRGSVHFTCGTEEA